jgi:hypothetical protein
MKKKKKRKTMTPSDSAAPHFLFGAWSQRGSEVIYLCACGTMNFIVFVFQFGTCLVITLNLVCVRLCELEKFGCVLAMIFFAFYHLRTAYARLKTCVKAVLFLLYWSPECPDFFPEFPDFPDSPDLARRLRTFQHQISLTYLLSV